MKLKTLVLIGCAVMTVLPLAANADGAAANVLVINRTNHPIDAVHVSPSGSDSWRGPNELGGRMIFAQGARGNSQELQLSSTRYGCHVDIRFEQPVGSNGDYKTVRNVDVCGGHNVRVDVVPNDDE